MQQILGGGSATPATEASPYYFGTFNNCSLKTLPLTYEQIRHAVGKVQLQFKQ